MATIKMRLRRALTAAASALTLVGASLALSAAAASTAQAALTPTPPAHVVVVVFENTAYSQIVGNPGAAYINNTLIAGGANLTQMYAVTHPSQPNYYNLFSGSTQGIVDDSCITPGFSSAPNLASEAIAAGKTWASYNEALPSQGSTVCSAYPYAQKHNPWFGFSNVPTSSAHTFNQFPTDYATLPQISFVIPDLCNDMHDCDIATGDTWLQNNLGAYAAWAKANNSVLIVTWDEDDFAGTNNVATVFYGQPVKTGSSTATSYNHFDLLHTVEDLYALPHAGASTTASDITGIWN